VNQEFLWHCRHSGSPSQGRRWDSGFRRINQNNIRQIWIIAMKAFLRLPPCGVTRRTSITFLLLTLSGSLIWPATAQTASRQQLHGHVPAAVAQQPPSGTLSGTMNLQLAIGLPLRHPEALTNLLQQLYDPASPNYHHFLTPQQFTEQFGPTAADYQAVMAFARARGLKVTTTHSNRLLLDVNGPVAAVEQALHVTLRIYPHPKEPRMFYAPDTEPSLDLNVPILHISGLDNYALPHPRLQAMPLNSAPNSALANAGSGPGGSYMGGDFRTAYVPDTLLTGSGQTVGLLQFDGYTASDIAYYENLANLPKVPLQNVLIDSASGKPSGSGGEVEVSLDIEMAISMAPGLSRVLVYMAPNPSPWEDILNRMATDNLAKQLSSSWYEPGGSANATADQIYQEMAAQGQSFFSASGDYDAYTGLIDFPGDSPYLTQVGGTTLTTSGPATPWVSETVWNRGNGIGSGGGISTQYPIPAWQTNVSMTASLGSTTRRNIPDVAMTAENIYVRANGQNYNVGGTSCAAPLWAGFAALVNQQAAASHQSPIGFVNPAIYAIGLGSGYASAFHDTTTGNNESSGSPTRFSAVSGYDLCTGWGTPNGQKLINALANPEALQIKPATGFVSSGGVGGPFSVVSQNYALTNAGTNSLSWILVNTSLWLNASTSGGSLTPGGPATPGTISLNSTASNLVVGTYLDTLWFTNLNDQVGQCLSFTLNVINPPMITSQPTNQAVLEGAAASFTVGVSGGLPLVFQWQVNGTNLTDSGGISGSTTPNLIVNDVATTNVGAYAVTITNFAGAAVSSNALLTITPSQPVIVTQPTNQTVYVGANVQFEAAALGNKPFHYQWSCNNTNIAGATNATLTLTNVQLTQSGNYWVTITNAYGSTNSAIAVLTVNPPPPCAPVSAGMVNWWQGEGNANDSIGTNNGTLMGNVGFVPGEVGQAFSFAGSSSYVSVPNSPLLSSFTTNITIELWLKANQLTVNSDWQWLVTKGNSSWRLMATTFANTVTFSATGLSPKADLYGNRNINDGQWHHVAGVYDGAEMYIYVDGTLDVSQPATGKIAQNSYPVCLGQNAETIKSSFNGLVDEVSLYNRALTAAEIQTIYVASIGGKCPVPPSIMTQPTNQTVNAGSVVTLIVSAMGMQPLNYQWSCNGTNLIGATNSTLTLVNVQTTNGGNYSVTVVNAYGSIDSSNALLTVLTQPPSILAEPVSQTNYVSMTASFSVTASGTPPLYYQWSYNSTNIAGATNATLTLTNVQLTQSGNYTVTITNAYGFTNSAIAVLTVVLPLPCAPVTAGMVSWWQGEGSANDSIGTNNGTLMGNVGFVPGEVGQAFSFAGSSGYVSVPNSPLLSSFTTNITIELWLKANQLTVNSDWQWLVTKGNSSWRLMATTFANTVTFSATGLSPKADLYGNRNINDGQWHHVAGVYDGAEMYIYVDGTLDVSQPATGTIAQNSYPVCLGQNAEAINSSFNGLVDEVSLYNRALTAAEIQTIYITGSGGKCFTPNPPLILAEPVSQTNYVSMTASFSVTVGGTPPFYYQWSCNSTNIVGATNATLTLTNVQLTQSGNYRVTITNAYGFTNSAVAVLTVVPSVAVRAGYCRDGQLVAGGRQCQRQHGHQQRNADGKCGVCAR
jgi:subtilase family serine protease